MKCPLSFICLWFALTAQGLFSQNQDVYFMKYPVLSPDASEIIFSYQGDLWKVSSKGGQAYRLTAMEGEETRPRISPDGQWIAFSASPNGHMDIYIMPYEGGEIRRLTWHEGFDEVESWSWDSEKIYFCSNRTNRFSSYEVSREGGTPGRLFNHYFHTTHNLMPHPDGRLFFNETWESKNFINRKGYRGPYNPDIKSYHPETGEYMKYTDFDGKDFGVTIDREGNIYYISTEFNGAYNLYQLEGTNPKRLTNFTTSVMYPAVSANGNHVVFVKDYQLYLYDVSSGNSEKLDIRVPLHDPISYEKDFNVMGKISHFDIAPDNKKIAFVSRGELFVSDVKGRFIRQIPTSVHGRVEEVHWLKDNRRILFSQTQGGYLNWYVMYADSLGEESAITQDRKNNRALTFNSDRTQAAYLSGRDEVRLMDLESLESRTLLEDEIWALNESEPYFSPDDQYVVFTAYRNFEQDILVHHLERKETINLTETALTETDPYWSPDGKYLYFTADRKQPNYPYGPQNPNLYRLPLQQYDQPYRSQKYDELFEKEDEKDQEEKEKDTKTPSQTDKDRVKVEIDTEQLLTRWESIGPTFGFQGNPVVIRKKEKTYVLFASNHDEGKTALWKLTLEDFEETKTDKIEGIKGRGFLLRGANDKWYVMSGGNIYTLDWDGGKAEKIDLKFEFQRKLKDEFTQMFHEVWANVEENFYDGDFHGVDWAAMRTKYAGYLPFINTREELRQLTGDMLGELNTSHYGFYSDGDEEDTYYDTRTLATGIVFEEEAPYQVKRIVQGSSADKVEVDIQPGDVLVAVDGNPVDRTENRERYFTTSTSQKELKITFQRGNDEHEVLIHPQTYREVSDLLYDEWEMKCQQYVDEQTSQRVAYVHMKNMGRGELDRFIMDMTSEGYKKEAVIVDLRYNTGGNVHDEVLRFLSQRPYLKWKYRDGAFTLQSNFGPAAKPLVLLINEQSLSDAEMTAGGFKALGLGTIIGMPTYRWIIFTTGKELVDGSFYRLPSWGCYTLDGENLEKTGVSPDIEVANTFKDRINGKDPQLQSAIDEIMDRLDD